MDVFHSNDVNGVLDARANVLRLKFRVIILNNIGKRKSFADEFQYALHGNSRAGG
jgi:hypothetical protein